MSLNGRAAMVKIIDENDRDGLRTFDDVKLTLTDDSSRPKLIIRSPANDKIELNLNDYSYVDESSTPGEVDCMRSNFEKQTVMIIDDEQQSRDLLKKMRNYLKERPAPFDGKAVKDLLNALNDGDEQKAAKIAGILAGNKQKVQFSLNMINESGNAAPRAPPKPVLVPLKRKLVIESFLIGNEDNQKYDVSILPETSLAQLKEMVEQETGIAPDRQFWYINREVLPDNYVFGVSKQPRSDEDTVLILYIAKP